MKGLKGLLTSFAILGFLFFVFPKNTHAQSASLLFSPDNIETNVGADFEVNILLDTAGAEVGGAGAKLIFDPGSLQIVQIKRGSTFNDYPSLIKDNVQGKATISGVVSVPSQLYSGSGIFASVVFRSKAVGSTKVNFDYTQGSTKDSNVAVTYGNGDILSKVNTLNVNIGESDVVSVSDIPNDTEQEAPLATSTGGVKSFFQGIVSWFEQTFLGKSKDPTKPIIFNESKTAPVSGQPYAQEGYSSGISPLVRNRIVFGVVIILLVAVGTVVAFLLVKKVDRKPKNFTQIDEK